MNYETHANEVMLWIESADSSHPVITELYAMHQLRDREVLWGCGYLIGYDEPRFVWLALKEMQTY